MNTKPAPSAEAVANFIINQTVHEFNLTNKTSVSLRISEKRISDALQAAMIRGAELMQDAAGNYAASQQYKIHFAAVIDGIRQLSAEQIVKG